MKRQTFEWQCMCLLLHKSSEACKFLFCCELVLFVYWVVHNVRLRRIQGWWRATWWSLWGFREPGWGFKVMSQAVFIMVILFDSSGGFLVLSEDNDDVIRLHLNTVLNFKVGERGAVNSAALLIFMHACTSSVACSRVRWSIWCDWCGFSSVSHVHESLRGNTQWRTG